MDIILLNILNFLKMYPVMLGPLRVGVGKHFFVVFLKDRRRKSGFSLYKVLGLSFRGGTEE